MIYFKFSWLTKIFLCLALVKKCTLTDVKIQNDGIYNEKLGRNKPDDEITQDANSRNNVSSVTDKPVIEPDLSEYILWLNSTSTNHRFNCSGNKKVKWYFQQFHKGYVTIQSNNFYDEVLKKHVAMLSLKKGKEFNTGYYFCTWKGNNLKLIEHFKKIYIFVEHMYDLLAYPREAYQHTLICPSSSIKQVIIPCRPSAPDIKVKLLELKHENFYVDITNNSRYEEKVGFTIETWCPNYQNKVYVCNAQKNNLSKDENIMLQNSNSEDNKPIASNEVERNETNVTLLYEGKPIIDSENNSESSELFCVFENNCTYKFNVSGYPIPKVVWKYINCKNDRSAECDELIKVKNISLTPVTIQYIITFTETGTLDCNASNIYGNSIKEYSILDAKYSKINPILYILLTLFLVIVIGSILWFIIKRVLKQKVSTYRKTKFEMGLVESWNNNLGYDDKVNNRMKIFIDKINMKNLKRWNHHLRPEEQAHLLPYDNRWDFPLDKIKLGKQIGSGVFGTVYKAEAIGIIDDNMTSIVAVKMAKLTGDASHTMALASELKIMTHIGRHLNIVNLLGACTTSISKKLLVIIEFCCFGSIDRYMQQHIHCFVNQITPDGLIESVETVSKIHSYEHFPFKPSYSETLDVTSPLITSEGYSDANVVELKKCDNQHGAHKHVDIKPLCTNDLLSWSYQVSKGMDYLASRKILHRDLASRNILLAQGNVVKICDFGLAKNMYESDFYRKSKKGVLPIKWLAIESMRYGIYSTASDVWSFGVVLWEIFSLAAIPYPNIQLNDLLDLLIQGYRMEQPKYSNSKIYGIMLDCWRKEPTKRPSFSDLAKQISNLLLESTKAEYVKLNEHHMKMYDHLPSSDILGLLAAQTRSNNSVIVNNTIQNTEIQNQNLERFDSNGNIEMKKVIVHNRCHSL